jgi:hypothetical protein
MEAPESTLSVDAQHALQDMVELQMYLVAQSQRTPWPLFRRGAKGTRETRRPHNNPVERSAVKGLIDLGFIERTSTRMFVVSQSGCQFYESVMKPHFT